MTLGNTNTGKAGTNTQAADASDATQNAQSTQSHIKSVESLDKDNDMERGLKNRHVQFIAIGGTIGTGLFLGSGKSIALTGPSIIFVYIGVGLIMFTNNTCDVEKDVEAGRRTLSVLLGRERARRLYHAVLLAWIAAIVALVAELEDAFDITIPAVEVVVENFNSVDGLTAMVKRLVEDQLD